MVSSLSLNESDEKAIHNDRASMVSSAKMHLGISLAQVIYLKETGGLPKEVSDTITKLHSALGKPSAAAPEQQAKPQSPGLAFESLNPPIKFRVRTANVPGTLRGVVAREGDHVIVFAWAKDLHEAIAYNTRNKTTGHIPVMSLDGSKKELFPGSDLHMVAYDVPSKSVDGVALTAGDYIRVWDSRSLVGSKAGVCFNLASGRIGKFETVWTALNLVD